MSSMRTTTPTVQNLPLHLLIEKQAQDIKYGQITYAFNIKGAVVEMKSLSITKAKRRRYKPQQKPSG